MGLIQDLADEIAAIGTSIGYSSPTNSWTTVKINPPALEIEIPAINLSDIEEAESQLGTDDWTLAYTVRLWRALRDANTSAAKLADDIEAFIAAVKANPTLGGRADDARVVELRARYLDDEDHASQPLIGYETTIRVMALV